MSQNENDGLEANCNPNPYISASSPVMNLKVMGLP